MFNKSFVDFIDDWDFLDIEVRADLVNFVKAIELSMINNNFQGSIIFKDKSSSLGSILVANTDFNYVINCFHFL